MIYSSAAQNYRFFTARPDTGKLLQNLPSQHLIVYHEVVLFLEDNAFKTNISHQKQMKNRYPNSKAPF